MTELLRAGVIGSGVFGGYHANKYVENPNTTLVAIFDVDMERAEMLASKHEKAKAYDSLDGFLEQVNVVTIASPAKTHFQNAKASLEAGKSVLVEKPIALTTEQARTVIDLAKDKSLILAVGHQERLVFEAIGLFDIPERPLKIEATRIGTWSGRGADVSVTMDLTIHDADLVVALFGEAEARTVKADAKLVHTELPDEITANIEFPSGRLATLTAGRTADCLERKMMIEYPSGVLKIDFVNREFENTTPFSLNENFSAAVQARDPLAANVGRFIDAVLGKQKEPAVDGEAGLRALRLVLAIDKAAGF